MKLKVIKNMVAISKYDKEIWDNYVSNFEKSVLLPKNVNLLNTKQSSDKVVFKNDKSLKVAKNFKKKKIRTRNDFRSSWSYPLLFKIIIT